MLKVRLPQDRFSHFRVKIYEPGDTDESKKSVYKALSTIEHDLSRIGAAESQVAGEDVTKLLSEGHGIIRPRRAGLLNFPRVYLRLS